MHFAKYQGAGNDFVIIDHTDLPSSVDLSALARRLCDRRFGIGADGLLILSPSQVANYQMRIFNADGSEPSMCGNGIRCLFDYIHKKKHSSDPLHIETLSGILRCRRVGEEIAVNLGVPKILHWPIELLKTTAFVVDTGVPHAVVFTPELIQVSILEEGSKVRFHPHFAPHGVNVNFACITPSGEVALRTYERGVEGETLSCGTGAAAAAFVAMKHRNLSEQISVLTRSSFDQDRIEFASHIRFLFPLAEDGQQEIEMLGRAEMVFEGTVSV